MGAASDPAEHYAAIRQNLATSYDNDAGRRRAMTPAVWRTDLIDDFAAELRSRDLRKVIELGAGTGQLAAHLAGSGFDVTATDLSPDNVAAIEARGIPASVLDFADIPDAHAPFDAGLAVNALLHVPKPQLAGVMKGVRRIIRPGGLFLMVVWGGRSHDGPIETEWLTPPRFFSFFSDEDFAALAFPGFTQLENRFLTEIEEGPDHIHPQVKILLAD